MAEELRVLVAGGAGFIGSNLTARLLADGHTVTVIDNLVTGREANLWDVHHHPRFRFIQADVIEPLPEVGPLDRVYHLASPASPPGYQQHPIETLRVNSEGTRNLLELAAAHRARFLYASTSEVYGDPLEHPQTETYRGNVSSTGPRSMYDEGKRYGEAMTVAYRQARRVDARLVRIFNTYGPNSDPADGRLVPNFITQALRGEALTVYGDGSQTRSLCYVSDLVDGLVAALEREEEPAAVVNLGNPREHTVLEYARLVVELTASSSPIAYRPPAVGDDPQRRQPDITRARALMGWSPQVSLEAGLARTITYFRRELASVAAGVAAG